MAGASTKTVILYRSTLLCLPVYCRTDFWIATALSRKGLAYLTVEPEDQVYAERRKSPFRRALAFLTRSSLLL